MSWYKYEGEWYKRCPVCNKPNYVSNTECYQCGAEFDDGEKKTKKQIGLKRCEICGCILTTEQYKKGYDYCNDCYHLQKS